MNGRPRILAVGYNACDVTVSLAQLPPADSKLEVPPILVGGGGPAATAAVAMARLGAAVRLLTVLADDVAGRQQQQELQEAGVSWAGSPVLAGHASPKAVILVHPDDGRRTILWSRGGLPRLPAPADPGALLEGCDLLYLDGHEPAASLVLARAAQERGLPVVLDAGSVREGTRDLVPLCTDVVAAAAFAPAFTGSDDPAAAVRALHRAGPRRAAITYGAAGVLALDAEGLFAVPAFAVDAVDTTGAGDAFHGGYAYALGCGRGFADALRWGAAVAALKCRDWGGRRGLPDRSAAEAFLGVARERALGPALAAAVAGGP